MEDVKLETKVFVEESQLVGGEGTDTFMTETEEESEVEAPLRRVMRDTSSNPQPSTSGMSTRTRAKAAAASIQPPPKKRARRGKNMPTLAVTTSLEEEEELKRMLSTANQELPTDLFQH